MKQKIVIMADDLTGTCDTSIKFLRSNARISAIVNVKDFEKSSLDVEDVVAVNTETRGATPQAAYDCLYALTQKASAAETTLFKKIDSVMRGNIAQEIDAVMDAADLQLAIVSPAYPDNGRQCVNGLLRLRDNGDWTQTDKSWLDVLGEGKRKVSLVDIAQVRQGSETICAAIAKHYALGIGVVVVDAERNEDLQSIAVAIRLLKRSMRILPVGCAGLAAFLSEELTREDDGFIFVVMGTNHPTTRRQIDYLAHRDDLTFYTINAEEILGGGGQRAMQRVIDQVTRDMEEQRIKMGIVLTVNALETESDVDDPPVSQAILHTLSQTAKAIFDRYFSLFDKFLISGGDTANGVLDAFGIRCIHMLSEPLSGIAYGWANLQTAIPRKVWIATKSGGFGETDTLDELIDYMSRTDVK